MKIGYRVFAGTIALVWALAATGVASEYTTTSSERKITVTLDFTAPRSYYDFSGKTLSWRSPAKGNTHYMRVLVKDIEGHALLGDDAKAAITTIKGKKVGSSITLEQTWTPETYHYGANITIPDSLTSGNVVVKIDPAKGRRLNREEGDFFTKPFTATFKNVSFPEMKSKQAADKTTGPVKTEWPKGRHPSVKPTPYPGSQ